MLGIKLRRGDFDHRVWVRFWGEFCTHIAYSMMIPFLTIYLYDRLDTSAMVVGLIVGIFPVFNIIGSMIAGWLSDTIGRRPVMVGSLMLEGIFLFGYIWAGTVLQFALVTALHSLAGSFFHPAANAMVADVTPEDRRAQAYGLLRVAANAGFAIGPLVGISVFAFNPDLVFAGTGTVLILFSAVVAVLLPETLSGVRRVEKEERPGGGYGFIFRDRVLLFYIVANILITGVFRQIDTVLPIYLVKEVTGKESTFAFLISINATTVVFFQMIFACRTEKAAVGRVLALSAVFMAAGFFGFALSRTMPELIVSMLVFTVGELLHAPVVMKFVVSLAPAHLRGRYLGVEHLSFIGGLLGPALGGYLLDTAGGRFNFAAGGVLAALVAVMFLQLGVMIRKRAVGEARA